MPSEKSCGAIVFRRENNVVYYLLLHYESGHWDFVKGNIEQGEPEKGTVIRELKEETGIQDANFVEDFREKIRYFYRHDGKLINKEVIFFLVETKTKDVKISFEHVGFNWLKFNEALSLVTFKNSKKVLEKANDVLVRKKTLVDF
jgi:8-oxo-dGTP pyrophosphatase MutT (NUDIX family)